MSSPQILVNSEPSAASPPLTPSTAGERDPAAAIVEICPVAARIRRTAWLCVSPMYTSPRGSTTSDQGPSNAAAGSPPSLGGRRRARLEAWPAVAEPPQRPAVPAELEHLVSGDVVEPQPTVRARHAVARLGHTEISGGPAPTSHPRSVPREPLCPRPRSVARERPRHLGTLRESTGTSCVRAQGWPAAQLPSRRSPSAVADPGAAV